jgi:gliding motility associated protien GldN
MIDLREKMNQPLYFPTQPFGSRMSLIDVLVTAIEAGEIIAYHDEQFIVPIEIETIKNRLGAETDLMTVVDVDTGETTVEVELDARSEEVKRYLILEQWYFDKQHSRFGCRIIGICPIRVSQRRDEQGNETEETVMQDIFWVYFPHIRDVLSRHEVLTGRNDLSSLSL